MSDIQYHGGMYTANCIDAVSRLLLFGDQLNMALLLTYEDQHAFLLTVKECQKIIIQAGFSSGYPGEGPQGLAAVIQMLRLSRVELDEVRLSYKDFKRVMDCRLSERDLLNTRLIGNLIHVMVLILGKSPSSLG